MSNFDLIAKAIARGNPNFGLEDLDEIYRRKPVDSKFWQDKRIDMKKIKCPVYIRGSEGNALHTKSSSEVGRRSRMTRSGFIGAALKSGMSCMVNPS